MLADFQIFSLYAKQHMHYCSKDLLFTQIHAQKHLRHWSSASSMTLCLKRCQISIKRCFSLSTSWTCKLLHLSPYICSHLGSDLCCWVAENLMKWRRCLGSEGWLSRTLGEQEHCLAGEKTRHKSHAWHAVAFESEAPHGSMRHWSSL